MIYDKKKVLMFDTENLDVKMLGKSLNISLRNIAGIDDETLSLLRKLLKPSTLSVTDYLLSLPESQCLVAELQHGTGLSRTVVNNGLEVCVSLGLVDIELVQNPKGHGKARLVTLLSL